MHVCQITEDNRPEAQRSTVRHKRKQKTKPENKMYTNCVNSEVRRENGEIAKGAEIVTKITNQNSVNGIGERI